MQRAQGFAQQGGETVFTAGIASRTLVQSSFPLATITVYYSGTVEQALIYSDNQDFPTPLSNPFTADINGHWFFYAPNGRYDVMIASPELDVPWTIGDILLYDPPAGGGGGEVPQTPWTSNIDGGGFNLSNVGFIDVSGGYLINGVPLSNPNLWIQVPSTQNIYHQGFIGVAMTAPNFAVDVSGGVNVTDNFYINGVAINTGGGGGNQPWIVLSSNRIQYNGQVGVNITPAHAFDVVGDINITGQYFINGVAIGTGGTGPWIVLTGSRINYNGQVGVNNPNPGYAMDVVGSVNVSQGFFVNGVALSTGGGSGLWIPGSNGIIFYNGGNVGIGTNAPAVALQVAGTVAAGQYAMAGNPTAAVINSSGAFVGAGVQVGAFGVGCASVTSTGPIHCGPQTAPAGPAFEANGDGWFNGGLAANTFALYNGGNPGTPLINSAGQFVGAGAATGSFGMSAAYFQANIVSGVTGSGNIVATNFLEANNGVVIPAFGLVINAAGAYVGAGVQVGAFGVGCGSVTCSGPVHSQPDHTISPAGPALEANGNGWFNGDCAANTFTLYNGGNPGSPLINSAGAFVGAGVQVGNFGIGCGYIQSNGNVVANAISGVPNSGFVEAANGFVVPGFGTVINSAGQWVGPAVGISVPNPLMVNGNIGGATFSLFNGTQIVNTGGVFVGGGVNTPGGVTANGITSNSTINAGSTMNATGGVIAGTGFYVGGSQVISTGLQFVGTGGVNTSGNINANLVDGANGFSVGGLQVISSAGIFTSIHGVQSNGAIYGSSFGIEGVAVGYPGQNSQPSGSAAIPTGAGHTIYVLGGLIVGYV